MSVIDSITKMQHDAVERLRAGDHSEFLVGFLTTSLMLELSNLLTTELDLVDYAQAVVETMTQHAPIDRCMLGLDAPGLPPVAATVGFEQEFVQGHASLPDSEDRGAIDVEGSVTGTLYATDVPDPLRRAGFMQLAAGQIGEGISRIVEAERERRRGAVARALSVVALLGGEWGEHALQDIASALASLPDATGGSVSAQAARFAGTITATSGRSSDHTVRRQFVIDGRIEVNVNVHHVVEPGAENLARIDEIVTALTSGLERIEQNIRLLAEAETDQLTGVGNRRRAGKALTAARAMADRQNLPMAVLLCDLDWFKNINDGYGHDVGDQVLVAFADLLQRSVRAFDTVTRWGGEEFLVILPTCDQAAAVAVADQLISECPDALASVLPANVRQTASIGIALYPDTANNPEAVIRAADDAMYQAKREGRDRFRVAVGT
jgi:diguanylate cyclase (GGDEF)-like protein